MANIQDLINLAKADGGKFFVIDETGEAKLVILPVEEYSRLLLGKLKKQVDDIEAINKQIIKAQLEELATRPVAASITKSPQIQTTPAVKKDLREEVIDLSFDFEGPRQDFDDI